MAGGGSYATSGAGVTCYAESTDGIHWTKPTLSVVAGTNIVDYNSDVTRLLFGWINRKVMLRKDTRCF